MLPLAELLPAVLWPGSQSVHAALSATPWALCWTVACLVLWAMLCSAPSQLERLLPVLQRLQLETPLVPLSSAVRQSPVMRQLWAAC